VGWHTLSIKDGSAIFLSCLGLNFEYEKRVIELTNGKKYLPDFFIHELDAYLTVKPSNETIVTEECKKARTLAKDLQGKPVMAVVGPNE